VAFSYWPEAISEQERLKRTLQQLGQKRLAESASYRRQSEKHRQHLLLLAAIAKRRRRVVVLSQMLELTHTEVVKLLTDCVRLGWIGFDQRLTKRGLAELRAARRHGRLPMDTPEFSGTFYFPSDLRMAKRSI
jgi:hypothetical protein